MVPDRVVDTIRVGGEISDLDASRTGWSVKMVTTDTGIEERGRMIPLDPEGEHSPRLQVISHNDGKVSAWIEGSVPNFANGANFPAATIGETSEVVREWFDQAASVVRFLPGVEPRVNRLDVVRDFELGDELAVHELLSAHASTPIDGRKVKANYADSSANHAETVMVRTRFSGAGRLYDKGKESRELLAAKGVLRFEAQERKPGLSRAGLELLGSLDLELVTAAGQSRFEWCGFDRQLMTWPDLRESILSDDSARWRTRLEVLGYASMLRDLGVAVTAPDRKADWRIRQRLRGYGYPSRRTMRLDYVEGLVAA